MSDATAIQGQTSPSVTRDPTSPPAVQSPLVVGPYRILGMLGRGEQAVVYQARHEQSGQTVALKVLRDVKMSSSLLDRFRREADLLAGLRHSGIAEVYDAGVSTIETIGGGSIAQPFLALELIEGEPIDTYVDRHRLPLATRLDLLGKIADAVHHAHCQGIIHRNLRPANILMPTGAGEPEPKILDFGLARITSADTHTAALQSTAAPWIETLGYMSPEQITGKSDDVDARSDIYSLGVLGYRLLAGQLPHDVSTCSIPEAANKIRDERPPRLGSIDTAWSGDIESIVDKCLHKDKADRYHSAAELASDIRLHLADHPIQARPNSLTEVLHKFARRHRQLVGSIAAGVTLLLLGILIAIAVALSASRQRDVALDQKHVAEQQAYLASVTAAALALQSGDGLAAQRQLDDAPTNLRGWEWQYLASRLDDSSHTMETDQPNWSIVHWQVGDPLPRPTEPISTYHLSNDKTWDAWATVPDSQGCTVTRRNRVTSRRMTWHLETAGFISSIFLTGPAALERVDDSTVRLWDLSTNAPAPGPMLPSVVDAGYDHWVVTTEANASTSATFLVDGRTGEQLRQLTGAVTLEHACVSRDGTRLFGLTRSGRIVSWYTTTGAQLAISDKIPAATSIAVSRLPVPATRSVLLATAGSSGAIHLWDSRSLQPVTTLQGAPADGRVSFCFDSTHVIFDWGSPTAAQLRGWNVQRLDERTRLSHQGQVRSALFSPDGHRILSGDGRSRTGGLRFWDADTGASIASWTPEDETGVHTAALGAGGQRILLVLSDRVVLLDAHTGSVLHQTATKDAFSLSRPIKARVSPDSNRVAISGGQIWEFATGQRLHQVTDASGGVDWSPKDDVIAVAKDNSIELWDAHDYELRGNLCMTSTEVLDVVFSPDGEQLAAACNDQTIRIFSVSNGACLAKLPQHGQVFAMAWHPSGTRLATGGRDQRIHIWETSDWKEVLCLLGHRSDIYTLEFSPDGSRLLSSSGDASLRIWDSQPLSVRVQAEVERASILKRLEPTVNRLLAKLPTAQAVLEAVEEDLLLTRREKEIARQLVLADL